MAYKEEFRQPYTYLQGKWDFNNQHTLIESSNRSVLKISLLENYTFLTNEILSTKYKDNLISIFHIYS